MRKCEFYIYAKAITSSFLTFCLLADPSLASALSRQQSIAGPPFCSDNCFRAEALQPIALLMQHVLFSIRELSFPRMILSLKEKKSAVQSALSRDNLNDWVMGVWQKQKSIWKERQKGLSPPDRGDFVVIVFKFFFGVPFTRVLNPPGVKGRFWATTAFRFLIPVYALGAYWVFNQFLGASFHLGILASSLLTALVLNITQLYAEQIISKEEDPNKDKFRKAMVEFAQAMLKKKPKPQNNYVDDSVRKIIMPLIYSPIVRTFLMGIFAIQAFREGAFAHHIAQGFTLMLQWGIIPLLGISLVICVSAVLLNPQREGGTAQKYSPAFLVEASLIAPIVEEVVLRFLALHAQIWFFVKLLGLAKPIVLSAHLVGVGFSFPFPIGTLFAILLNTVFFHQGHELEHRNSLITFPLNFALSTSYAITGSVVVSSTIHLIWNTSTALFIAWAAKFSRGRANAKVLKKRQGGNQILQSQG